MKGHKWFAAIYDKMLTSAEKGFLGAIRKEVLTDVSGEVVLCSVRDPRKVLAEIKRVLKPGGELRLYEHVRYQNPIGALSQDIISPVWQWFGAGCHPNRDTGRFLREAGFEVTSEQMRKELPPIPPMIFSRPHLQAVARVPALESVST